MKNVLFILMFSIPMEFICAQNSTQKSDLQSSTYSNERVDTSLLDFYRQYSLFTNPGEYEYLYENLPDNNTPEIQITKSFESVSTNPNNSTKSENN